MPLDAPINQTRRPCQFTIGWFKGAPQRRFAMGNCGLIDKSP
jgi:hypothetical protein